MFTADKIKKIGSNCIINPTIQFYGDPDDYEIGDNVRIDAFCIFSGKIKLGSFIHIACGCYFFGTEGIWLEDYSNLSSRISLYTVSDDFVEGYLTSPMVPDKYKKVKHGAIHLKKHALIGCGSVVLPGVTLGEGCSIGALSLIKDDVSDYNIMAGCPARHVGIRNDLRLKNLERQHQEDVRGING